MTTYCEKCQRAYKPLRRGYCNRCDMDRRARIGYQCSFVDAEPVRKHVQDLRDAGMGTRTIAAAAGISRTALGRLINGSLYRGSGPTKRMHRRTADAILAIAIPTAPHLRVAPGHLVDAIGTVRRGQALVAFGYPRSHIAARLGLTPANATHLFKDSTQHVRAATAAKMAALFCELENRPGISLRARREGKRNKWPVPMQWDDDIDMPSAAPQTTAKLRATAWAERYVEMRDFLQLTDRQIADKLGIQMDSLERQKVRHASDIDARRHEHEMKATA